MVWRVKKSAKTCWRFSCENSLSISFYPFIFLLPIQLPAITVYRNNTALKLFTTIPNTIVYNM